jgi:hypothetical protein
MILGTGRVEGENVGSTNELSVVGPDRLGGGI